MAVRAVLSVIQMLYKSGLYVNLRGSTNKYLTPSSLLLKVDLSPGWKMKKKSETAGVQLVTAGVQLVKS